MKLSQLISEYNTFAVHRLTEGYREKQNVQTLLPHYQPIWAMRRFLPLSCI